MRTQPGDNTTQASTALLYVCVCGGVGSGGGEEGGGCGGGEASSLRPSGYGSRPAESIRGDSEGSGGGGGGGGGRPRAEREGGEERGRVVSLASRCLPCVHALDHVV